MEIITNNQVRLCRKGSGCGCPIVEKIDDDNYSIVDDYNGRIQITKDQLSMLKETAEYFEQNL